MHSQHPHNALTRIDCTPPHENVTAQSVAASVVAGAGACAQFPDAITDIWLPAYVNECRSKDYVSRAVYDAKTGIEVGHLIIARNALESYLSATVEQIRKRGYLLAIGGVQP